MSRVNTVLGPDPDRGARLRRRPRAHRLRHARLRARHPVVEDARAALRGDRARSCGPFHENCKPYGAATYVDATGICNGRDVELLPVAVGEDRRAHRRLHRLRRRRHRAALLRARQRRLPHRQFVHEITVGIGDTGARAGIIKVGVSRGFRMKELDLRIYRAAARAALATGVPIFTHLAVDVEPAIEIFHEEGLPLDRVLFGHADDGVSQGKVRDTWIADQGGRIGFDTFGYDLELPDPPFWGRPRQERLDHFLRYVQGGRVDSVLASADANCSPLGWPGVKGHTVNYLFEVLIPALREAGRRRRHDHPDLRRPPRRLPAPLQN